MAHFFASGFETQSKFANLFSDDNLDYEKTIIDNW